MIRRNAFWLMDRIKGGKLNRILHEIAFMIEHADSHESLQLKKDYLSSLLSHSVKTTQFYKAYDSWNSITDFPVINKNIIRNNYKDFRSNQYTAERTKQISTSGSTGIPFTVDQCEKKVIRNQADNLFFSQMCGYTVGDPIYYLRIWNEVNRKSKWSFFVQNTNPIDISDLSEQSLEKLVKILDKLPSNSIILSYGSTYDILTGYLDKKSVNLKCRPKVAFVMSDPINQGVRLHLSNLLHCPIYTRYSNAENGFLGHQWQMNSEEYLMNSASYHIEILNFVNDQQVSDGQPGRVVVTDLFNYAVPMIRYDTGDIAIKVKSKFNGATVSAFKSIEGRKLDFITNTNGDFISPHSIDYALRSLPKLIQFQIIQKERKRYQLKLHVQEKYINIEEIVQSRLQEYLGVDALIDILFVEEIPLLKSGKRKIVINELIDETIDK
jgi:phenylacetate-CoA ligase